MPRVIVKQAKVDEKSVNGKIMRSQMAELELADGYALPFRVGLGTRPVYPVGDYDIDPKCFGLSQYGDLQLNRYVDLVALPVAKPKAA